MLSPKGSTSAAQQRLLKLFRNLPAADKEHLVSYAEFLAQRDSERVSQDNVEQIPADIPRPTSESVVAAIKRLSETFYMLDKDELLHEASTLMTAHVMQGRDAVKVIDELEVLFRRHYERLKSAS